MFIYSLLPSICVIASQNRHVEATALWRFLLLVHGLSQILKKLLMTRKQMQHNNSVLSNAASQQDVSGFWVLRFLNKELITQHFSNFQLIVLVFQISTILFWFLLAATWTTCSTPSSSQSKRKQLMNRAGYLAAKEQGISLRSWWRPNQSYKKSKRLSTDQLYRNQLQIHADVGCHNNYMRWKHNIS